MSVPRLSLIVASLVSVGVAVWPARAATPVTVNGERVVPSTRIADRVSVRDLRTHDGEVSGVLVNTSDRPVRDVQLLISYQWLWNNETHPGEGGPGRAVFYTVQSEIPPGGQMPFTYRPESALSERPDGRYMTNVTVAGFTDITPSTTSGVSQAAPPPAYPEQ
jgi:hypothetical protein